MNFSIMKMNMNKSFQGWMLEDFNMVDRINYCWWPCFESVPKSPYGGKPNEKQGPKTHQEDQRARKVQKKNCKGKRSTAKRRSIADYKSVVEYRSAAEYSFLVEWLW